MKRSFTLIEVLVAIAILGIISISFIPAIYNLISMNNDNNEVDLLYVQDIVESYKASHFNGEDFPLQTDSYSIYEERSGGLQQVKFVFYNEVSDYVIHLTLPADTSFFD